MPSFRELSENRDGDYAKGRFIELAREILSEGRRPERVFMAMMQAAYMASIERSIGEHYAFVRAAYDDVIVYKLELEKTLDRLTAESGAHGDQPS